MGIALCRKDTRSRRGRNQILPDCWYRRIQAARILRRCDGQLTSLSDRQIMCLLRSIIASRKDGVM